MNAPLRSRLGYIWLALSMLGYGAEVPVGLITASEGAKLRRAGSNLPLSAPPGEFLFSGDVVITAEGGATVAFCPQKASYLLPAAGEFTITPGSIAVTKGALGTKTALPVCEFPAIEREASANLQTYGSSATRGTLKTPPPSAALQAALEPVNKALQSNPSDLVALVSRATLYQKYGLEPEALQEFKKLSEQFGADRLRGLVHQLDAGRRGDEAEDQDKTKSGNTYALLVGISQYQKLDKQDWLAYADHDAATFAEFLQSPRGGAIPANRIQLLVNDKATTAAIRTGMNQFLKEATPNDTVVVLVAAHGVVDDKTNEAYIVTYDSNPEDLHTTGILMSEIQEFMNVRLTKVARALVYVDVCRAGTIGTIKSNNVNSAVEQVLKAPGELLGLMASRSTEYSWEGPNWGGGHGAFSYFILQGLSGEADEMGNKDGIVSVSELIEYVRSKVKDSTQDTQHPVEAKDSIKNSVQLADTEKPGITLSAWTPIKKGQGRGRGLLAQALPPALTKKEKAKEQDVADFEAAIEVGRIIPETPGSAYNILRDRLASRLTKPQYRIAENELRVALEDQGQQVILRYLDGDQVPQTSEVFQSGARYFEGARLLTPDSAMLESKALFCRGRVQVFAKRYQDAVPLLERAARIDPKGAYSFNALGIGYLEQAKYDLAIEAFEDAVRLAPHWAYPRHNLALSYSESGQYDLAIRTYQDGIKLGPRFAYLSYNLGLLYQRLNQRKEAEQSYRKAIEISPDMADAYNALGLLYASSGKFSTAEKEYREALTKNPNLLAARHNLGLLLINKKGRQDEAFDLWRENIAKDAKYLPSRLILAEELAKAGNSSDAVVQYRAVIELKPDYSAARIELARLLTASGKPAEALEQLREALRLKPGNVSINEQLGDTYLAAGRGDVAQAAYREGLKTAVDSVQRKRLQKKLGKNGTS
ncbi:MAG: tetratricopeptide repeat protein [Acidobacteriota bacterium]|nr:tetratricopeptide repeat protein [Acidobacteriota bacterium]